MIVIMHMISGL